MNDVLKKSNKLARVLFVIWCCFMGASSVFATSRGANIQDGNVNSFQAILPGTSQAVSVSGSSAQSSALTSGASIMRLVSTTDCYVAFGTNPTATTSSLFLPANVPEYFGIPSSNQNETWKVAVIQSTASGTLNVSVGQ